jgi:uncharacterized membrane protein
MIKWKYVKRSLIMSPDASVVYKPKKITMMAAALFIIITAVTILILFQWSADRQSLKENGQPDFNTLPEAGYKDGLIVKGNIDIVLGSYAEKGRTSFSIRISEDSESVYYVLPVYDEDEYGNLEFKYLITYLAGPADYEKMDEICINTWNYEVGAASLNVENARIHALPNDIRQFFYDWAQTPDEFWNGGTFFDWCAETQIFGTDDKAIIGSKLVPFMIDKINAAGTDPTVIWIFAGVSVIMLIILIALIRRDRRRNASGAPDGPDIMRPMQ